MTVPEIDTSRVNLRNEGGTTVFAYPKDQRFSDCLNVPPADPDATTLLAESIGAPRQMTLLNPETDWGADAPDLDTLSCRSLDQKAVRRAAVQAIAGDGDKDTREIIHSPGGLCWKAEAEKSGLNRIERLRALQNSFEAAGVDEEFDLVPGVDHEVRPVPASAEAPFARQIERTRGAAAPSVW